MTVSRVINGESNVRAETRKKVEAAIKALDYSPSSAARTLAGARRSASGCSTPIRASIISASCWSAASIRRAGSMSKLIVEKCDDEAEEQSAVDHLIARGSTGSC